ncbi:MAG: exodeoxyribonuclease VII large subunit [Rickettsiales bacterium]|nr:exodeoxyribonuclease VII large subunit [Rickettsiales bacterium]
MRISPNDNIIEYSVSEISRSIKSVIESGFGLVKIRGEISNLKFHQSGHVYFNLKDENSVINGVCFKNVASTLKVRPEEGLEVVALGKVTTYSGRSNYQIIVTSLEVGGIGSLMALFEKRKKELLKKGYFDIKHKKQIAKFPDKIYVITSETGAVIKDILHRIEARYPLTVCLAPVKVQGHGAEIEISNTIKLINEIADKKLKNTIIIARGGGSIEDLWCFNEEIIVKSVFDSEIPIISAIGHETDTTLIDYVADLRAPTPTAAAELATPEKSQLQKIINDKQSRINSSLMQIIKNYFLKISFLSDKISQNERILNEKLQKTDDIVDYLHLSIRNKLKFLTLKYDSVTFKLRTPKQIIQYYYEKIDNLCNFLNQKAKNITNNKANKLNYISINKYSYYNKISNNFRKADELDKKLTKSLLTKIDLESKNLSSLSKLMDSLSYKNVLKRGFSIIRDENNKILTNKEELKINKDIEIEFYDDKIKIYNINNE